jgi:hypothetical protein
MPGPNVIWGREAPLGRERPGAEKGVVTVVDEHLFADARPDLEAQEILIDPAMLGRSVESIDPFADAA